MESSWKPVLSGPSRTEALAAVEAVTRELHALVDTPWPANLIDGHLGLALFFDMASRHSGPEHVEAMTKGLVRAVESFGQQRRVKPGLHQGLGGLGWTALHLARQHPHLDVEELCAEVDEVLASSLEGSGPWGCELREGLPGLGLYALERLPHPAGRQLLERVVDRLEETAEHVEDTTTWALPPPYWTLHGKEATFPRGLYTVGVAHGVPAALAVLAAAHRHGIARERTERLLRGGFAWLARLAPASGPPAFPHFLHGTERFGDERFSWCVGNPGITAVLWWAAHVWGDAAWEARALAWASEVAREALHRAPSANANLCCGTSGTALLFLRLFHATRRPVFEQASVRWLEHTLALRRPGQGVGGFLFESDPQRPVANLQFGAAGIALALLAGASELEPTWDAPFLFSLRT